MVPMRSRQALGVGLGLIAGLALAWMDSRPGFDATGLTAVGLLATSLVAVLVSGGRGIGSIVLIGVVVGVWIPIVEIPGVGAAAPLMALVFSIAGAATGALVTRALL
jgi:hypothetical protein